MRTGFLMLSALLSLSSAMYGQATPTAVATNTSDSSLSPSFGGPLSDGMVHYALSAAQLFEHGLYSGSGMDYTTSLSGSAGYMSSSERYPFRTLYTGGLLLTSQSQATVQTFQNAFVSQQFITPRWIFGVSDSVSYLPQSPTTGYSGVAGVGGIGTTEGPGQGPAGGILTNYGTRISNSLSGDIERKLTASTSMNGMADWTILRFINGEGLDTTGISSRLGLDHRVSGRTSIGGFATYSIFTYGSYGTVSDQIGLSGLSFQTRGLNLSFQRLMTHNLSLSISAGPQLITSSNKTLAPSTTTVAVTAEVSYSRRTTTATLGYARGANGGSGVQQGSIADSVLAAVHRSYGRDWVLSVSGSYRHSSQLIQDQQVNQALGVSPIYDSVFGGVQVTRRLGVHVSGYMSYTVISQSGSGATYAQNVFTGVSNIAAIGVTWAPRSTSLSQLF